MAILTAVDLVIENDDARVELMLLRPQDRTGGRTARGIQTVVTPVREGDRFAQQEAEALYRDWSGGGGYGERLAENVYHYDAPGYSRQPFLAMPPGRLTQLTGFGTVDGPITGSFYSRADLFFVGGAQALRLALGTGTPFIDRNLGSGFSATSAVNYGRYADGYVAGTGGNVWRFNGNTGAWAQLADVKRQYLETVYWVRGNVGAERLVGSTYTGGSVTYTWPDRSILYTDNAAPITESLWSEEILIGHPGNSITGLAASNQHLYVLKSSGLHDVDDRLYSPNLTPYLQDLIGTNNAVGVFNGHVYFSTNRGLDRVSVENQGVRQDRPQRCSFGFGLPNYSPISGEPTAISNVDGWLAASYYNETAETSYLCYGIDYRDIGIQRPGIGGPLLWHGAEAVLPGVKVTHIRPFRAGDGSWLYLGGEAVSTGHGVLYRQSLPSSGTPYQDHLNGGTMEFADEWVKFFPRETWGNDTARKDLTQVSIRADNLGAAVIDAYREIEDEGFGGTSLGQASTAYEEFAVDEETDARDQTFKVVGTGNATTPALLKALAARAAVSVEASDVIAYVCEFGYGVQRHSGQWRGDPVWIEDALKTMQGRRATLRDFSRNREYTVRVLQGISVEWEEYPSGERTGRAVARLSVQVLDSLWYLDTGRSLDEPGLRLSS